MVLIVVIVVVGEATGARIDQDLACLSVLRAHGLDEAALPDDLNVRVAVRLQLLADLGFRHWLVTGNKYRSLGCAVAIKTPVAATRAVPPINAITSRRFMAFSKGLDISTVAGKHRGFNAALTPHRRRVILR